MLCDMVTTYLLLLTDFLLCDHYILNTLCYSLFDTTVLLDRQELTVDAQTFIIKLANIIGPRTARRSEIKDSST